jgi:hypothetical protein
MKEQTRTIDTGAPPSGQDPTTGGKVRIHLNWEMFAIWSVVVVSFAVFLVAGYIIWAKCNGR